MNMGHESRIATEIKPLTWTHSRSQISPRPAERLDPQVAPNENFGLMHQGHTDSDEEGLPRQITIYPDYGGCWAWAEDGCCIAMGNIGLSELCPGVEQLIELDKAFENWQYRFETDVKYHDPELNRNFDWGAFHMEGIALCKKLQNLLASNCNIIYRYPYEDPYNPNTEPITFD